MWHRPSLLAKMALSTTPTPHNYDGLEKTADTSKAG